MCGNTETITTRRYIDYLGERYAIKHTCQECGFGMAVPTKSMELARKCWGDYYNGRTERLKDRWYQGGIEK